MSVLDLGGIESPSPYQEFVSSYFAFGEGSMNFLKLSDTMILPRYIDDLSRDLRSDIYEQMLLDAQCAASYGVLVDGILGGECTILPGTKDPRAKEMADFATENLFNRLETSLQTEVFPDLLLAMVMGHRIAEKVYYEPSQSPIPGKLCLQRIKTKSNNSVAFCVDRFKNVLGIADLNASASTHVGYRIYDRSKFVWLTWKMKDSDPRGNSVFRPAYDPWWFKQKIKPIEGKHLTAFGSPSLVATLAPGTEKRPKTDSNGNVMRDGNGDILYTDPGASLELALQKFTASGYIILPDGTRVDLLQPKSDGAIFPQAKAMYNIEIVKGITYQQIATEGGSGVSAGAAGVAADILEMPIDRSILRLKEMANCMILRPLIDLNYPEPQDYPTFEIPGAKRSNLLAWASAIAKLALAGCIHPEQLNTIFSTYLNLPPLTRKAVKDLEDLLKAKSTVTARNAPPVPALPVPKPVVTKGQAAGQETGNA